ncbi:hypothetical protein K491DRAFT_711398 [Lophiostoma macrostomum CBS 122681]|uniref:Uncharacterized protein n=1 Tax=Lophiostoma macrostomum CBS 122681 TaxID=1314788 RepID=A0A6A6TL58_9PLEO|nr:hypothetical protein K491DRAFT_711398 [Lophiostoma macrostomum CBS 122681]
MHYSLAVFVAAAHAHYHVPNVPRAVAEDAAPLPTLFARQQFAQPCEEVSASWSALAPESTGAVFVGAKLAYDCLNSVPVDAEGDVLVIQELKRLAQFQSNLNYMKDGTLKDGPDGVLHNEPVDILGELDAIATGVQNGTYESEFEVQFTISQLLKSGGDNHFSWRADIMDPLRFLHDRFALVSLSKDGKNLPKVYVQRDLFSAYNASSPGNFTPSAIKTIDGKSVVDYINDFATTNNGWHDADAQWNRVFVNQASNSNGEDFGSWTYPNNYVGPTTTYAFENGSTIVTENKAYIGGTADFTGVTDGSTFFAAFCQGAQKKTQTQNEARQVATSTSDVLPTPMGRYPSAAFVQSSLAFQGYYLNGTGYDKTAVLAIPDFGPKIGKGTNETVAQIETQKMVRAFFADAVSKGKEKLIIDLRGNGGGTIDVGFDLFKQLFPDQDPFGGTRYRAHEAHQLFSAAVTSALNNNTLKAMNETVYDTIEDSYGVFDYRNVRDANGSSFTSFWDYYGPYENNNDTFTSIRRYNYSNIPGGYTSGSDFNVTGYLSEAPAPPQPFKAENIILVQDGSCSSTCAIFSELVREQAGVQQIAVGGRPQYGAMQGVGGTKGANIGNYPFLVQAMTSTLQFTAEYLGESAALKLNASAVGAIAATSQLYIRSSHADEDTSISGGVNMLDNLRQHDATERPLEFYYEAADCRLFDTFKSWADVTVLWKAAYDAKWGNGTCVQGSTGDKTSISVVDNSPFNGETASQNSSGNSTEPGQSEGAASGLQSAGLSVVVAAAMGVALLML